MRARRVLFVCVLLAGWADVRPSCALDAAQTEAGYDPVGAGCRTLRRTADPVVVRGGELAGMEGQALEGFRLLACRQGSLQPVPYQIDEVDEEGLFVLPEGRSPNRDRGERGEERDRPGLLDSNDELVFMAADLGDRRARAAWPVEADRGVEIEVIDPATQGRGWAYLFWFRSPPPPSQVDYVRYARQEDRIHAEAFSVGYAPDKDLVYTTYLGLLPGGTRPAVDVMDRINIRFSATIFLRSITFSRHEDDFVSEVIAYKDGPVRVMRRVANRMRLVFGLKTPRIIAYSVYYRDAIETPNVLDLPVSIGAVARSVHFEGGTDHNRNAIGMRFYTPTNPDGSLVDGRMSPEELVLDHGEHGWTLLTGQQGHVLARLTMDARLAEVVGKRLIYVDDGEASNAPEAEAGTTPKIGFSLENILELESGVYRYNARFYFLPDGRPDTVQAYLRILDEPLQVRVHR